MVMEVMEVMEEPLVGHSLMGIDANCNLIPMQMVDFACCYC